MRCARPQCGRVIENPDPRQRYCDDNCSAADRQQRRRDKHHLCRNCNTPTPERFCSKPCRWSYLQRIRKSKKTNNATLEPMPVLLPFGCNPVPGDGDRRVYCRRYERCLSFAVSKKWGGFDCQQCAVTELDIPSLTRKRNNYD